MRRGVGATLVALALGSLSVVGTRHLSSTGAAPPAAQADDVRPLPSSALPESAPGDRGRVLKFWSVYQEAAQAKQAGRWEEAADGYRRALELDPAHWDSLYYLGNVLVELGHFEEAHKAYLKLAASDIQAARAHSALGALYSRPEAAKLFNLEEAREEYHRAWRSNADESGSVLRLGEVTLAAGDLDAARDYLAAAGRTNFRSVNARFLQGYLAWREGDRDGALGLFKESVGLTKEQKPPGGVLGEGDTKLPGYRPILAPGQRGLFDGILADLWRDRDVSQKRMDDLYGRVRDFIDRLPKRTDAPVTSL